MPINFVTGLPRHGKTLWTLVTVRERAEREKREVYTCNIPGITIPGWHEIQHPDEWLTVPNDAIIIIDELQDFWQKSGNGSKVPEPILELSKHGKRGIDFYFITQEPDLVHATPRSLCAYHFYVVRAFGAQGATVRKFERMQSHPEKVKKSGELSLWKYPREAFEWYKSADVHNIKRAIPMKLKLAPLLLLVLVGSLWAAYHFYMRTINSSKGTGAPVAVAAPGVPGPGAAPGVRPGQPGAKSDMPLTAAEYVAQFAPRLVGLPHSAPRYDELTKPVSVPFPAACVSMGDRCTCYTQQATKMDVKKPLCLQIVKYGFFNDWQQVAAAAAGAPGAVPVPGSSVAPPPVTHLSGEGVTASADVLTPQRHLPVSKPVPHS